MSDHVRDLLPGDAAGALERGEAERLAAHLRECTACAGEAATWRELARELRRLEPPRPSAALVARTRWAAEALLTERAEQGWERAAVGVAVGVAWMLTAGTWLLISAVTSELARLEMPVGPAAAWYGAYLLAGTLAAAAAAMLLGRRAQREGRMA